MSKKLSIQQQNQMIRELIHKKDQKGEKFAMSELEFLSLYEGKGGQAAKGEKGEGLLYEFYTPTWVVELMWQLARFHGYRYGSILEPSFATGRFFKEAPDESLITGFEIDPVSFRIAQLLYPKAMLYNQYFETAFLEAPRYTRRIPEKRLTWLSHYPFSLVIGNPPYGKHRNLYSSYYSSPRMAQMELFFIYWGLKLLRPGGLLIYITSSNILRNGISYQREKQSIEKLAELKDAYRLPPVFQSSQVPTDIIILKRKEND